MSGREKIDLDYVDSDFDRRPDPASCYNCNSGWKHGCCDDLCIGANEANECEDRYACKVCNPDGEYDR